MDVFVCEVAADAFQFSAVPSPAGIQALDQDQDRLRGNNIWWILHIVFERQVFGESVLQEDFPAY
jgi:hypothetical protein